MNRYHVALCVIVVIEQVASTGGPVDPGTAGRGRGQPINQRNSKMMVVKDRKKTTDWQTEE